MPYSCTHPPLHMHTGLCLQMLYANPLIHLRVCRLVPVSAPWQPGVWGPCEDHLLVLLRLIVTRKLLLLQGQAHPQWAAGEGGWSRPSVLHIPTRAMHVRGCEVHTAVSHLLSAPFVCQFIEKRREMKQDGRTEQELTESYCFLYPDKSKVLMMAKLKAWCLFFKNVILSFVSSLVCPAPVDLRKGSVGRTLQDYNTRKSISG